MIDRGDIRQAIDRCSNIWASLPGAGYGCLEYKADSLIAKFVKGGNGQRLMYEQSHRDYLRSQYSHHRLPVMGRHHYRDNAITLQSLKRQKCQRTEAGERGNYQIRRCVSVMLLRSMQNTRRS